MMSEKCSLPTRSHIRHAMKQVLGLLWLYPATTTYSTYWCLLDPSIRKVVWTLMSRRILGLTRFSTGLSRRLGLTHTKLKNPQVAYQVDICKVGSWGRCPHNLQKFQGSRIEWHHLGAFDALVLSCPGLHRRGITSLHVTTWCRFLNVVVW